MREQAIQEPASNDSLADAQRATTAALLAECGPDGHWIGELSTSALSTATAVMALEWMQRARPELRPTLRLLIENGLHWLARHQNRDGGWGDTVLSMSNIATTMLCDASFRAVDTERYANLLHRSRAWIDAAGGVPALRKRYGKDKTFSVPILTHCALGGVVPWTEVMSLPFELGCLPHRFFQWIRLPVVSYALPALIAIGQLVHTRRPSWNPVLRKVRNLARPKTLDLLTAIQPTSGGFLEAAPLTSFVTMSLAGMGLAQHEVAEKGLQFLIDSVRPDGSWPIDTNLATWVTTLSVNALEENSITPEHAELLLRWLLGQQYRSIHPYTQAAPGGWAWTNLSGGVPDADDTPGAMLAVIKLAGRLGGRDAALESAARESLEAAATWLLDLQNRDGGWPTFCRGWGALPFDRSSNDLTAHALRALHAAQVFDSSVVDERRAATARERGLRFLKKNQGGEGAWRPLWFGNQHARDDENPVYGTSKVLVMAAELGFPTEIDSEKGARWLAGIQNADGGWGGAEGCPSSIEETALATEALLEMGDDGRVAADRGLRYLGQAVRDGRWRNVSPIGFYFAKLWYFERLYPMIFTTSAMNRARKLRRTPDNTKPSVTGGSPH
ncbi:Squalene--hopene cyclase [Caulifigura coniformis]|uniref:Squalene--hopene cyclase n=1 Tax=Caulifigura coniformis TaxID=2527983 RepID=A0A517SIX1_9PLAN|nr:prenyltransferase/squalene oxidase repeat-containing protein [Caulifigura coniformis]QDT56083.1 Squalene--hopene cyclase [Caulifigura coniformis]